MSDTKKCPCCGKEIKTVAKKCRYCGEWINVGNPGTSPSGICVNTTINNMPTTSSQNAGEQSTAKEAKDFAVGMAKGVGIAVIWIICMIILTLICWKLFG